MENFQCLVCNQEMESKNQIAYTDYFCKNFDDHHLTCRIRNGNMIKLRIRFREGSERLCLKIHYDDKYSEVWSKSNVAQEDRLKIDSIIVPDFSNIEKLKNKIRTILVFG